MYIITLILELTPETDYKQIIEFYEKKIALPSLKIPAIERINCVQLISTPYNDYDTRPLRNLFYQIQISFTSEEAVEEALQMPETMGLIQRFIIFSKCKFHFFVGHEHTFYKEQPE
ncbi:hypothetical protein [Shimazuella alba]|uniref:DUF4286 family protein n=1 Tax=Shimazuella alba TaxID=2690964 RepID=A0A6I4W3E6_9BACL|nr:hypothetical protein [Shimazuella alba]MXQ54822.1 hypothetical protein [Shimazuella alba]